MPVAVRCNNDECLGVFLMVDGPDVASEDDVGVQPVLIPKACPYCGKPSGRFSLRTEVSSMQEAVELFAEEERGAMPTLTD
jgi:hypothetical protein